MAPEGSRLVGIDAARGLAVLGMVAAHVGDYGIRDRQGDGWEWLWIADGRPSAAFALLAGVTISLMALGRSASVEDAAPPSPTHTRVRIAVRAVLLIAAGYALAALDTPVIVVLMSLGVMMLIGGAAIRLPSVALAGLAAAAALGGPFLVRWIAEGGAGSSWYDAPVVSTLWGHYYTGFVWLAYVFTGMLIGRLDLRDGGVLARVFRWGVALALAGYALAPAFGGTSPLPDAERGAPWWLSAAPHGTAGPDIYAPAEVVGNTGIVLVALAALAWLGARLPGALAPVAAVGALALTVYVAHVVAIWAIDANSSAPGGFEVVYDPSNATLVWFWVASIAMAWAWRALLGPGPLERAVTYASSSIANATASREGVAP